MDSQSLVIWINQLIQEDKLYKFYKSKEFKALRIKVLEDAHYECQYCRQHGIITRATIAHHCYYVRQYPQHALSQYVIDDNGDKHINLMAVCHRCHEDIHKDERLYGWMKKNNKNKPITDERWD